MSASIYVGFDGSAASSRAVWWALHEGELQHLSVCLVRAYEPPAATMAYGYGGIATDRFAQDLIDLEEKDLADAVASAQAEAPSVEVTGTLQMGSASSAILRSAEDASLIVLGSRGLGGFRGLLLGSVGQQVAAHAKAPVVVVRGDSDRDVSQRVVVAIDGSPASQDAVGFAFEFASRHGLALHALHAWEFPVFDAPGVTVPPTMALEEIEDDEIRVTAEALAGWAEKFPDVRLTSEAVQGSAEQLVVDASANADLLVVGSRGRGGFTGLLLGSVSQAALHHAHCPVVVVRPH